jgi:hypothetical protein
MVAASRLKALGVAGGPAPASGGTNQLETLVEKEAEDGPQSND